MKIKKNKSAFASGAPPCSVSIEGSKPLNRLDTQKEYNGLLVVLAAILEQNNGRVLVSQEALDTVRRQKRVLQIVPAELSLSVQFDTFTEDTTEPETVEDNNFLESSIAQEAREFLAKQKETK